MDFLFPRALPWAGLLQPFRLVVPALDHPFRWSTVSPYVSIFGDALVMPGFLW